jgi:hypothetical protein
MQFIAYCHIAIESQSMRRNKGDGSIYFKATSKNVIPAKAGIHKVLT